MLSLLTVQWLRLLFYIKKEHASVIKQSLEAGNVKEASHKHLHLLSR